MILDIIKWDNDPNQFLRRENVDVKCNDHSKKLIIDIFDTLEYYGGVGLAAPQVGKNLNMFIVSFGDIKEVFINPKIKTYGHSEQTQEMCLSVPNIPQTVTRRGRVKIQYYNKNWYLQSKEYDGILSRIIQHEYDHLLGKLIVDY